MSTWGRPNFVMSRTGRKKFVGRARPTFRRRRILSQRRRRYGRRYRTPTEFPSQMFVKLKNVDTLDLSTAGANAGVALAIRVNGPYDPYYPTGGGTPSGYTQYANMYNMYLCYGASYKAIFTYYTNNQDATVCGMTAISSMELCPGLTSKYGSWLTESKGAKWKSVPVKVYQDGNPLPRYIFKKYCNVKRIECMPTLTNNDNNYTSLTNTTPLRNTLLYCVNGTSDGSTQTASCKVEIVSTYYVKFFQPKIVYNIEM